MSHAKVLNRYGLLLLLAVVLTGCKEGLYSGLTEQESNEIVAALAREGIDADKERSENSQWQVLVDKSQLGAALTVLREEGLPRDRYASMGDVFEKQGLVSTPSEERMRYIFAMSQELSETLRNVDGVIAARVHVVIPANDPLSDKIRPSSAAVFIKHQPDVDLRLLTPAVKELVAHSIEGLSHDQVSLSLFESRRTVAPAAQPALHPVSHSGAPNAGLNTGAALPSQSAFILLALLIAAAVCVAVLPGLLRKHNLDWRTWLQRQVLRR